MENAKISVIVPVYNVEDYLHKCLDSIIDQTYKNLEIILVDDGSPDNCGKICDEYAEQDNRIKVIHKLNGGVSSARNAALNVATGEYVGFVDADDWIEPDMYRTLIELITDDDIDIATCGYCEDYHDKINYVQNNKEVPEYPMFTNDFLKYIYIRDEYRNVAGYIWTKLFRTSIIKDNKILFNENLSIGEDVIFLSDCYLRSKKTVYTKSNLYHYVQHDFSAFHNYKKRIDSMGSCIAYQYVIDLYEKNNIDSSVVDYVKRFYVYHASVLLKLSYENNYLTKVDELKSNIMKHLDVYCRTNSEYPKRIAEIKYLLNR